MSNYDKRSSASAVFTTLGWPLLWGGLSCLGFYSLIHFGIVRSEFVDRYFSGHIVQYIETVLFLVGLAAVFIRTRNVAGQFGTMRQIEITPRPAGGQPVGEAADLLEKIRQFPSHVRQSYLVQRLETIFEFVNRKRSAAGLEDELKHQSDLDSARQHEGYALVRMIIWATPMLGFLGTVIGITLALGDLSPQSLVATPELAMEGLLSGLGIAFDTTALALSLSMVLMFCQYVTNQLETALLEAVDARVDREMLGRFQTDARADSQEPNLLALRNMSEAMLEAVETTVEKQAEVWNQTLGDSQERWDSIMNAAGTNIEASLESAFRRSIHTHAQELARNEELSQGRTDERWEQLQSVLTKNADVMQSQQVELVKQGDLMLQAINATGEVTKVQHALNENMRSLSLMGKFDETVMSLSAAINLLNARMSAPEENANRVRLYRDDDDRRPAA